MKNLTRSLTVLVVVLVLAISATLTLALPKIDFYRYQNINIKTADSWVKDEANWPKDKKILLLVHGLPILDNGKNRYGLVGLANHYSQERKIGGITLPAYDVIYAVEYLKGFSVFEIAGSLANALEEKTKDFSEAQKFDIFAHSLGGLPVRGDLEIGSNKKVGHVVFMGTPHNGVEADELQFFRENFDFIPIEISDLNSEGMFLTFLNSGLWLKDKKIEYDYYSIVGTRSWAPEQFGKSFGGLFGGSLSKVLKSIQDKNYAVHDGLIGSESAGYDLSKFCRSFKLITLNLNHEYIKSDPSVYAAIDKWMIDDKWFPAPVAVVPKAQTYTGGMPIYLGKNRSEVVQTIGFGPPYTRDDPNQYGFDPKEEIYNKHKGWQYQFDYYNKDNDFSAMSQRREILVIIFGDDGKVFQSRQDFKGYYSDNKYHIADVLPKEICERKPDYFCVRGALDPKNLVLVWYFNNQTFVIFSETKYDSVDIFYVKTDNWPRCRLNDYGKKFMEQSIVKRFICINGKINFFDKEYSKYAPQRNGGAFTGCFFDNAFSFVKIDEL